MARVLVVDDDTHIRQLLSTILLEEGHEVEAAADGVKALELLRRHPPHLLVLDVMMPRKDGYSVLKEMKAADLLDRVKVLLLTAKNSEEAWLQGYELGADHYVTKPFEVVELVNAVGFLLATPKHLLRTKREHEIDKAQLLSRLDSLLDGS